jgi:hypothetical protein
MQGEERSEMLKMRAVLAAVLLAIPSALHATENGTEHYPVGVNTIANGYLPPPGMLQMLDYFQINPAGPLKGNNGNTIPNNFNLRDRRRASLPLYVRAGHRPVSLYAWVRAADRQS